jgi:hypothetical protein
VQPIAAALGCELCSLSRRPGARDRLHNLQGLQAGACSLIIVRRRKRVVYLNGVTLTLYKEMNMAQPPTVLIAVPVEKDFEFPTNNGIFHANETRDFDENISVPGGTLLTFTFHEGVRRNAEVHFESDDSHLRWSGQTKTNIQGESGNFGGHVSAMFVQVKIALTPQQQGLLQGLANQNLGAFTDAPQFLSAVRGISKNLLAVNDALGGGAAVAIREVDSKVEAWHARIDLPEGKYLVVPSPDSRWALSGGSGGPHDNDFHGTGDFNGNVINVPLNPMRLGGLAGVLFVVQPAQVVPVDVFQFPPGTTQHVLNVPPGGGILEFRIGDLAGAFGDNDGTCKVGVFHTT